MKNQYILMLTEEEVKNLINLVDVKTKEILLKQSEFYDKKSEVDKLAEDIQELLK